MMESPLGPVSPVPFQIATQGERQPQSIALRCDEKQLTYKELNDQANQFARLLTSHGLTPGQTVAVCLERSFEGIAAALGIMRAGAAYLPLDPVWPDTRLRFAVSDSGAVALVARTSILERLQVRLPSIDPCRDAAAIATAVGSLNCSASLDGLAYLIYTSGSTGVPKGVEITHANLAHLVTWHRDAFRITPHDHASHLAGPGFDASVWEIWPNLCAGAAVCLADDAVRSSPKLIQRWMLRERVTVGFVPTVHALPMMEMDWPQSTALRVLLTGGDSLLRGPEKQLPFEVINNYGPTECTVVTASGSIEPGLGGRPTIGWPIAGTTIHILDEQGKEVTNGRVGDLYIGGNGVGRGYRNLPELTRQAFVVDPFAGKPGSRLYRTGDRAVRRANGEIEFHGRLDRQVKIRGQRVELDEISSVLLQHPLIAFAVATLKVCGACDDQLKAYILFRKETPVPTSQQLQQFLLRSLPDYMVPSTFMQLRAVPSSPNGKLDFAMLEELSQPLRVGEVGHETGATLVESNLLMIVRKLLGSEAIGANDNFFLAGGHSLLGMQLLTRLKQSLGVDLTLQQLFDASSVKDLAGIVEQMLVDEIDLMTEEEAELRLME
jgi:amino acid adenylation domain-containing protein